MKDKMDKYEAQEGKVIDFYNTDDECTEGLVVGCDKDVGITIVNNDDHDDYLYCVIGPSSSLWNDDCSNAKILKTIPYVRDQIEEGVFHLNDLIAYRSSLGFVDFGIAGGASQETCSFGQ